MRKSNLEQFFGRDAEAVAHDLIGCELLYRNEGRLVGGRIVETEAYTALDPASHSFKGPNKRNRAMFGQPGTVYIYFIYGIHYCLNIVTGQADGQAVLLRAVEPTRGIEDMFLRRPRAKLQTLCNGPAKLVQAFGITPDRNGMQLAAAGFTLLCSAQPHNVITGPRIGISKAVELTTNYRLAGSSFTST